MNKINFLADYILLEGRYSHNKDEGNMIVVYYHEPDGIHSMEVDILQWNQAIELYNHQNTYDYEF